MLKTKMVFAARIMSPPGHSRPLENNPCLATCHCCLSKVRMSGLLVKDQKSRLRKPALDAPDATW
jgi:hypothetical protein